MSQCLLADGFPRTIQDGNPQRWSESSPLLRTFFLVERRSSDGSQKTFSNLSSLCRRADSKPQIFILMV